MKWYLLLFVLLSFSCKSRITVTEEDIGADMLYEKESYKPYSGICIVTYNHTDLVKEQFTFKNGVLHGESLSWYKNGKLRRKGYYHKGQISGKWTFFDEDGNQTIEANYKQDILHGSYISLYSNGRIKEKGQFDGNKPKGKWVMYDQNGHLISSKTH